MGLEVGNTNHQYVEVTLICSVSDGHKLGTAYLLLGSAFPRVDVVRVNPPLRMDERGLVHAACRFCKRDTRPNDDVRGKKASRGQDQRVESERIRQFAKEQLADGKYSGEFKGWA